MPTVVYIAHTGATYQVQAPLDKNLMQLALDHGVPGILGDCGGSCSCATCHGYVDEPWASQLPVRSDTETFMLEGVPAPQPNSRLCCQIRTSAALDGITVRLPASQI
jgi:2Fe-2S ferredoxin